MSILRFLGISDIHYHEPLAINKIIDFLDREKIELVVVSGDLTTFGNAKAVKKVLTELNQINKQIFYIQGNMDSKDSGDFSFENIIPLHGRAYNFAGYNFVGIGGSTKTPVFTPYTMSEITLKNLLEEAIKKVDNKEPIILVSHNPPLNSDADKLTNGKHVGSSDIV